MSEDLTKKPPKGDENVASILQHIDSRLERLEQKVDERLYDTRPIWEKVVADIAQLQDGQQRLEETVSSEFRQINKSLRDIYYQLEVLNDTMLNVQAKHKDVDRRVRDLEAHQQKPKNSST